MVQLDCGWLQGNTPSPGGRRYLYLLPISCLIYIIYSLLFLISLSVSSHLAFSLSLPILLHYLIINSHIIPIESIGLVYLPTFLINSPKTMDPQIYRTRPKWGFHRETPTTETRLFQPLLDGFLSQHLDPTELSIQRKVVQFQTSDVDRGSWIVRESTTNS